MKYLDERIIVRVTVGYPYPNSGIYKYNIYEYYDDAQTEDEEIIFVGNYYYSNQYYVDFDITDIVRSRKDLPQYSNVSYTVSSSEGNLLNKYKVKAWTSNGTVSSSWETVAMVYRYPNSKGWYTDGSRTFEGIEPDDYQVNPALQGSNYMAPQYLPHYPLKNTTEYAYNQLFLTSSQMQEFQLDFRHRGGDVYYPISTAQYDSLCTATHILLSDIADWRYVNVSQDASLYTMPENNIYYKVAIFDYCPKRYYLQWQDRFGGYQSQAFSDYATFTETFDVTETENYKGERKKSYIQVQPKWKINSGWIPEDWYFIYESIFISPTLILYDTYKDKSYQVILNDNYTEKTYRSEKKMLNLTLELEEISKQNIIY